VLVLEEKISYSILASCCDATWRVQVRVCDDNDLGVASQPNTGTRFRDDPRNGFFEVGNGAVQAAGAVGVAADACGSVEGFVAASNVIDTGAVAAW
jgi:hypothetical protein